MRGIGAGVLALLWLAADGCHEQSTAGSRATIHVNSASGHDGPASGCSAARPLRTLAAAQAVARRLLRERRAKPQQRSQGGLQGGVTISASAGVYSPLALTALDSGTNGHGGQVRGDSEEMRRSVGRGA